MTHTGRPRKAAAASDKAGHANPGFKTKPWRIADKGRGNMDAAEYKHAVLGLTV